MYGLFLRKTIFLRAFYLNKMLGGKTAKHRFNWLQRLVLSVHQWRRGGEGRTAATSLTVYSNNNLQGGNPGQAEDEDALRIGPTTDQGATAVQYPCMGLERE